MPSRSIAKRLVIGSTVMVVAVFTVAMAMNYAIVAAREHARHAEHLDIQLSKLASSLEAPMWSMSDGTIEAIAEAYAADKDIVSVRVLSPLSDEPILEIADPVEGETITSRREILHEGELLGTVIIESSKASIFRTLRQLLWYSAATAALLSLTLALGIYLLLRVYLARPLRVLGDWAEDVARGDYGDLKTSLEDQELQTVALQFARMSDKVSEREALLRRSEKRFRDLADLLPLAVFEAEADGTLKYVNKKGHEFFGYTQEEVREGIKIPQVISPRDRIRASGSIAIRIRDEEVSNNEYELLRKDGTTFQGMVFSAAADREDGSKELRGVIVDITQRKEMESQLRQSQKLEALGTLAGGIAHDFNNILSAILGFTELAQMDAGSNERIHISLDNIAQAGSRARDLVAQILAFSRQSKQEGKPLHPKIVVKEVLKLLRASLPATVEITQNLESDSSIVADPTQLHQVVMNLCANAAHAMREEGGTLAVGLEDVDLGPELVAAYRGMAPGLHVALTVRDTGHGMVPKVIDRIFEPFFTTKPQGEGTGMGLSAVHGIMHECGGAIAVESSPGVGTVFRLYFPVAKDEDLEAAPSPQETAGGTDRILFVDDEDIQCDLASEGLGRFGYRVTAMTDPLGALELFRRDPRAFDLVVTDMTMPNMTGDILARQILQMRRDVPVIICTGFSEKIDKGKAKVIGVRALVHKPVVASQLARTIRAVLDGEEEYV